MRSTFYVWLLILMLGASDALAIGQDILEKIDSTGQVEEYEACIGLINENLVNELDRYLTQSTVGNEGRHFQLSLLEKKSYYLNEFDKNVEALNAAIQLVDLAEKYKEYYLEARGHISAALVYEKIKDLPRCKKHLDKAEQLISKHEMDQLIAYHAMRASSYFRFVDKRDSSLFFAKKAVEYAKRFNQPKEECDAYLLMGSYYGQVDVRKTIHYMNRAAMGFVKLKRLGSAAYMYSNVSDIYFDLGIMDSAMSYSDTALAMFKGSHQVIPSIIYWDRAILLNKIGKEREAFESMSKAYEALADESDRKQREKVAELTLKHQADNQDEIILRQQEENKAERQRFIFLTFVTLILAILVVFLYFMYRRINQQNVLITSQTEELMATVQQKEVLLHEIHHRLKNNLQMVIGLLDMQRHSSQRKTQEELLRESKTRILSMAYLHSHLYENENFDQVDVQSYLESIGNFMMNSYVVKGKMVEIVVDANEVTLSIDQSLPVGLVAVELMSNSFKYAFEETNSPRIVVKIRSSGTTGFELDYSDNGKGIKEEDRASSSGMGMKIIEGLVKQLKGEVIFDGQGGFSAKVYVK